jgi:hypothetical protein
MRNPVQNARSRSGPRSYSARLVFAFVVGLVLGWVVIGWWLWPVRWTNSEPWDLRPEHQRTYVALVAESYWRTGDVARAREALDGWDDEGLARLLATMMSQASTPEERQRLADLAEALALPETQEGGLTSLLDQRTIVLSALVSALPLVLAIILAVSPLLRKGYHLNKLGGVGSAAAELEGEFERLLAGEEEEDWGYQWAERQ